MNAWEIFYREFVTYEGYETVLEGLLATVIIAVCGLLIGFVVGCILAVLKIIPAKRWYAKIPRCLANIYVALFRGTPMVVQLLLIHFVIFPIMHIDIPTLAEAVIAFGLNSGAYICEIMRGGIQSVDAGQMEAGARARSGVRRDNGAHNHSAGVQKRRSHARQRVHRADQRNVRCGLHSDRRSYESVPEHSEQYI